MGWPLHLGKSSSSKILHPLCWQHSTSSSWETIIDYFRGKTPSQHQLASRPCPRPLELVSSKMLSRDSIRVNGVDIILRSKASLSACSFLNTIEIALIKSQSSEFSSGYPWVPQQYFCFVDLNRQCVFPSISSWTNKPGNKEMTQECCSLRLVAERKEETSFEKWWGGGDIWMLFF